jgi:hypothetical protein
MAAIPAPPPLWTREVADRIVRDLQDDVTVGRMTVTDAACLIDRVLARAESRPTAQVGEPHLLDAP